jgi:hypothetical protein
LARNPRTPSPPPAVRAFLERGEWSSDLPFALHGAGRQRELWRLCRDAVLPAWIAERPGTRPWAWWRFDAPEPARRRLGGTGTPAHEVLAVEPESAFGLPTRWITRWMVEYCAGRAVNVSGNPIGQQYRGCPFPGVAIDPADPPRFESEAAYLNSRNLLTAAERAVLTNADFEPELVTPADEPPARGKKHTTGGA